MNRTTKAALLDVAEILHEAGWDQPEPTPSNSPVNDDPAALEPKLEQRGNLDPRTTGHEYSDAELEFLAAIQEYKHESGSMFPAWSEVLNLLQRLGYEKSAVS
ncbi:MAG TPA: hypothetical protein VFT74_16770, partial [Isosphaeraceae bacterium]|nr:hypothetical protein [Isosphaeraceae bacterium]